MHLFYEELIGELGKPLWYDWAMCPRYLRFHPRHATIHGSRIALIEIRCQACNLPLLVALDFSVGAEALKVLRQGGKVKKPKFIYPNGNDAGSLAFHGDPPGHLDPQEKYCHLGCTMTAIPSRIVEFWERGEQKEWERLTKYEIAII